MMICALAMTLTLGTSSPASELGDDFQDALTALEGGWSGVLIYRDYRTDARVTLPHQRTVTLAPDASYAHTAMAFTDPGYQVYASELLTLDGTRVQIASASGGQITLTEAQIRSLEATPTGWRAILTGPTMDAGELVEARYTYQVEGDTLSIEKAVRSEGDTAYLFRNGIEMTRQ